MKAVFLSAGSSEPGTWLAAPAILEAISMSPPMRTHLAVIIPLWADLNVLVCKILPVSFVLEQTELFRDVLVDHLPTVLSVLGCLDLLWFLC